MTMIPSPNSGADPEIVFQMNDNASNLESISLQKKECVPLKLLPLRLKEHLQMTEATEIEQTLERLSDRQEPSQPRLKFGRCL